MFFTQRCTTHKPWCLLLARRVKKEWKQAQGGDGCAVSTGLYSLFPRTKSCGGQEGNSDPLQQVSKGGELPNEKPDLPMCGRSLHLSRHSQILSFLLCRGKLFSLALSCIHTTHGLRSYWYLSLASVLASVTCINLVCPKNTRMGRLLSQGSRGNLDKHHFKATS